ncbi:MAG: Ig-like domain-containing protein, partial [Patescibacteria group bacterium]
TIISGATVPPAPASPADTTAPSTPPGLQKVSNDADATPTFAWNATSDNIGVTSYLIQIDNGSLIDNGGSTSYTIPSNLANGSHTFKVLAKDATGNTSPTSSFSFTVNASSAAVYCPLTMQKAYKSSASKAVYYITTDCTKRPFKNGPSFFTYFDSWSEVITTTKTILDSIANDQLGFTPAGPKYDPKYGALVKIVTDPKVYLLLGTEKYWIISESVFTGLKYDWKWIEDVDSGLLDKYSIGSEITYTDHHPNYTIIKYAGSAAVHRLEPDPDDYSKQVKRWIKNEKVFNALKFRWDRIVTVPNSEVYKDGKIMDESEVNL